MIDVAATAWEVEFVCREGSDILAVADPCPEDPHTIAVSDEVEKAVFDTEVTARWVARIAGTVVHAGIFIAVADDDDDDEELDVRALLARSVSDVRGYDVERATRYDNGVFVPYAFIDA